MSLRPSEIVVSGAGLVGGLLAIFLAHRGYRVTVFERRADMRTHEISAGRSINLALAHRGIRPLERAGLMDQVRPTIIPMRGRMLHDERGSLSFLPYGQRSHEVIYSVSRGELNKLLLNAAEATGRVKIRFEEYIESVDFERSTVKVQGGQGIVEELGFELLIGADGGGSAVRHAIDAYYGESSVEEKLFHSYKELHIAPDALGKHRMQKEALHIWPRGDFMLIALPNPDGSFTVTLFLPDHGPDSFAELTTRSAVVSLFERRFPDALALMPDVPGLFFKNPTGLLATVHCPRWFVQNQALLIGDAAHAIVPFHGQGMNCGFEDCAELDRLLAAYNDDWGPVFAAYEAVRKPNGEAIALMAQENYVEMRSSVRDPKFLLKKELSFELERRMPERFIPRYSMVMFHHLPYAEALHRGRIQEAILDELCANAESLAQVDLSLAERMVTERVTATPRGGVC